MRPLKSISLSFTSLSFLSTPIDTPHLKTTKSRSLFNHYYIALFIYISELELAIYDFSILYG
jgi:hypothetical protein